MECTEQIVAMLRACMRTRGPKYTMADLARDVGVWHSTISRIMAGHTHRLNPPIVAKLCRYLDVTEDELVRMSRGTAARGSQARQLYDEIMALPEDTRQSISKLVRSLKGGSK